MTSASPRIGEGPNGPDDLIAVPPGSTLASLDPAKRSRIDVDFSLAIHNRTGKYFIGKELLAMDDLPIGDVWYWRRRAAAPLDGLHGRIVGRLQHWEVMSRVRSGPMAVLPRRRSRRPLLHLDPFTVPTARLRPCDGVLIHDLGPVTHPELFPPDVVKAYKPIYDHIAHVGPHLVFVSHTSRLAFEQIYPATARHGSRVVSPPIREGIDVGELSAVAGIEPRFLLTVGSIGTRKNQAGSIAAYARSGLAERGIRYVICGGPEPGHEDVLRAAEGVPGVHVLPYVSDAELRWLYQQATGFVLMSFLEGFGMPVGEAVRHNLVPLISRGGVLREVAGEGALEADAHDVDEIARRMVDLCDMPGDERATRLAQLEVAIERFDLAHFRKGWRDVIFRMLSGA